MNPLLCRALFAAAVPSLVLVAPSAAFALDPDPASTTLASTGSENPAIVIAAGAALVVLAAVLGLVALLRRRASADNSATENGEAGE